MGTQQNIVILWREFLKSQGKTLREGCKEIMQATDYIVDHSHSSAWQKGTRALPREIYKFMLDETYDYALKSCGLYKKRLKDDLYLLKAITSLPGE